MSKQKAVGAKIYKDKNGKGGYFAKDNNSDTRVHFDAEGNATVFNSKKKLK